MFEMAKNSMILFARGKLFKDMGSVFTQALIGIVVTAAIFLALVKYLPGAFDLGLEEGIWLSTAIAAFIGGALQPYLFKDLKYA